MSISRLVDKKRQIENVNWKLKISVQLYIVTKYMGFFIVKLKENTIK